jgi:DNA-binding XRE family transcriptional regulator
VSTPQSFKRIDGNHWPTAIVETDGVSGIVQIKPPITDEVSLFAPEVIDEQAEKMWRQVGELDEADADILEGLYAMWIYQARTPQDDAIGSREALLKLRGVKRKKAGNNRRGGYSLNQLDDVSMRLGHLINFEVDLGGIEAYESQPGMRKKKASRLSIKSRAVIISDTMGQRRLDGSIELDMFLFHPGRVIATYLLGPGYTTALLSIRALHYDPYRQRWEKRITRYLSWQWRIRAFTGNWMQTFSVRTLLEKGCKEAYTPRRKSWQQERFEKMMDTVTDKDDPYRPACGWQYDAASMDDSQGNLRPWIERRVLIEPPDLIPSHYESIQAHGEKFLLPASQRRGLGGLIQQTRLERGLTRLQAAEEIGISPPLLSMIESGSRGRKPSKSTNTKIQKWLKRECA